MTAKIIMFPIRSAAQAAHSFERIAALQQAAAVQPVAEPQPPKSTLDKYLPEMVKHIKENQSRNLFYNTYIENSYKLFGVNEWDLDILFQKAGYEDKWRFFYKFLNESLTPDQREIRYTGKGNTEIRIDRRIEVQSPSVVLEDLNDPNNRPCLRTEGIRAYNKARKLYDTWKDMPFNKAWQFFRDNNIKCHYWCAMD